MPARPTAKKFSIELGYFGPTAVKPLFLPTDDKRPPTA